MQLNFAFVEFFGNSEKKEKKIIPVFTLQQEEVLSEAFSKVSTANIESTARKSVLVFV